jgi:cellulose synthase/poly-beta-1,6-N-acetylglucosamine synthase-like glycosyltransferase
MTASSVTGVALIQLVISGFGFLLALVVTVITALQMALIGSALIELRGLRRLRRYRQFQQVLASQSPPRISVLMPAYNEAVSIVESVRSSLSLTYPDLEVVVVDDGSSDATLLQLVEAYGLVQQAPVFRRVLQTAEVVELYRSQADPRLVVARKRNGGKADALNAAINLASGELICSMDADTIVNPDSLQLLVAPFLERSDMVAVGGTVRLSNGGIVATSQGRRPGIPSNVWAGCQMVEYTRAFLIGRLGWNRLGGNLIVSGAFGVFRHRAVMDIGGYHHGSVGEDMDLVVRLRRRAYEQQTGGRVEFSAEPVAWTEAPERLRQLRNQRDRWFRGLLDVLVTHRRLIGNPRYGSAGLFAVPYFVVVEALAPFLEALGILAFVVAAVTGRVGLNQLAVLGTAYGIGIIVSLVTMIIDDVAFATFTGASDRIRIVGFVIIEQLVFRVFTVGWRIRGAVRYLRRRTDWGVQQRKGFGPVAQG